MVDGGSIPLGTSRRWLRIYFSVILLGGQEDDVFIYQIPFIIVWELYPGVLTSQYF
jgi:hypothetical protein